MPHEESYHGVEETPGSQRLTNDDFRKLLMTPRSTPATAPAGSIREAMANASSMPPPSKEDRSEARRKKKSFYAALKKQEDSKLAELAEKYRDRARERRDGANPDYQANEPAGASNAYRAVAPDLKSGLDAAERRRQMIQESKFLGGDMEHTHLVKGLDYALLQKVRSEITHIEVEKEAEMELLAQQALENMAPEKPAVKEKPGAATKEKDPEEEMQFKTKLGRNIVRTIAAFKSRNVERNELFAPGRMAYVIDLDDEVTESDIPTTLIRSKADVPVSDGDTTTLSTNDIVINKLAQILSYLRQGARGKKGKKKDKGKGNDGDGGKTNADDSIYGEIGDYQPSNRRHRSGDGRESYKTSHEGGYFGKATAENNTGRDDPASINIPEPPIPNPVLSRLAREPEGYAECYPGLQEMDDAIDDSDDEVDYTKMDLGNKKGPIGRWDFDTQEEYSVYMSTKEALPKAAFQYGLKTAEGRRTRKHTRDKNERAELDREWQKIQVSTPASTTYVAGVVEFARNENFSKTIDERIADNLDQYIKKIKEANTKDVDIIVFPEDTLNLAQSNNRSIILAQTTAVPDPQDRVVPYLSPPNTYKNVLTEVSREAKQNNMYVVVNLAEKSLCNSTQQSTSKDQPCAPDGFNIFNTNVVLDRNGTVVSRYRKFNLFGEPGFNATAVSDISNFTTDFGVTFGHFICFDIMFSTPALNLVRGGIRHFLFPSMWFSELPFLTGVQVQENWAIANDVVLLAAGASNPHVGSGGSGIYVGKSGSLKSLMNGKDTQQLIVATVPKAAGTLPSDNELPAKRQDNNETYEALDNLKLKRDDIDVYSTKLLEKSGFNNATLCSFSHCCTFEVNTTVLDVPKDKNSYKYRLAVFNGVRTFSGIRTGGVTICAIVACSGTKLSTCGIRFQNYSTVVPSVVFNHVKISGNFPNRSSVLIIPNTLTHAILPLARNQFNYTVSPDQTNHQLVLTDSVNNLQTFGIYGRDFEKDGRPVTRNSSSRTFVELVVLSVTVIPFLFSKMC